MVKILSGDVGRIVAQIILDPDLAMDILYEPIYYRLWVRHLPLDEAFVTALPQQAIVSILNT